MLSLEGVKYAALLTLTLVIVGGAAFASIEKDEGLSTWDGIYWAASTVTTVGSDIQPTTTAGRVLTLSIVATGICFVSFLTAFVADRFFRKEIVEDVDEREILAELREIRDRLDRLERP